MRRPASRESGQSLVETVAAAPIVLLAGLLALQALTAGANFVYADNAAHAGVVAASLGGDPRAAARHALPGWARGRVHVTTAGGRLHVRLSPRALLPGIAPLLSVSAGARLPGSRTRGGS